MTPPVPVSGVPPLTDDLIARLRDTMRRQEWVPATLAIEAADVLEAQAAVIAEVKSRPRTREQYDAEEANRG